MSKPYRMRDQYSEYRVLTYFPQESNPAKSLKSMVASTDCPSGKADNGRIDIDVASKFFRLGKMNAVCYSADSRVETLVSNPKQKLKVD